MKVEDREWARMVACFDRISNPIRKKCEGGGFDTSGLHGRRPSIIEIPLEAFDREACGAHRTRLDHIIYPLALETVCIFFFRL